MTKKIAAGEASDFPEQVSGEAVLVLDRNHRVLGFNDRAQKILRADLTHGERLSLEEHFDSPGLTAVMAAVDRALSRGGGAQRLKARAIDAQGIPFDCVFSVNPLMGPNHLIAGVIISIRDTAFYPLVVRDTLDPLTGQPLRPSPMYESLLEHLAEGIFTINIRWQITSFNQTAEKVTGFTREEVLGRYCWDIFRSDVCKSECPSAPDTGKRHHPL